MRALPGCIGADGAASHPSSHVLLRNLAARNHFSRAAPSGMNNERIISRPAKHTVYSGREQTSSVGPRKSAWAWLSFF